MATEISKGIIDPMLYASYQQHETSFTTIKGQIDQLSPEWNKLPEELKSYQEKVDTESRKLQYNDGKMLIPLQNELDQVRWEFVDQYWKLKATCDKIDILIKETRNLQRSLVPQSLSSRIQHEQPELYNQQQIVNAKCTEYFTQLGQDFKKLKELHQKIKLELNGNIAWSVQRFCQIVDNKGMPITTYQRFWNNVYTPVVPSLDSLKNPNEQKITPDVPIVFNPTVEEKESFPFVEDVKDERTPSSIIQSTLTNQTSATNILSTPALEGSIPTDQVSDIASEDESIEGKEGEDRLDSQSDGNKEGDVPFLSSMAKWIGKVGEWIEKK